MASPAPAYAERRQTPEPVDPAAKRAASAEPPAAATSLALRAAAPAKAPAVPVTMLLELALDRLDAPELRDDGRVADTRKRIRADLQRAAHEDPEVREQAER